MVLETEKKQISRWITEDDFHQQLVDIGSYGWFSDLGAALKFAICVAIKFNLPVDNESSDDSSTNLDDNKQSGYNRYNNYASISQWDEHKHISDLICAIYPNESETPYRYAERLGKAGIMFMKEKCQNEGYELLDFLRDF